MPTARPAVLLLAFLLTLPTRADDEARSPTTLFYPNGLALDPAGNLYISDIGSHRVLKLDRATNHLTPVAGTGEPGFSGDNGPATAAHLHAPMDLLFDADGNLLIADTYNHRVRRIDKTGTITTVVGNGKTEVSNDPRPALDVSLNNPQSLALDKSGNLYIADTYNHVVRRLDRKSGQVTTFAGTEAGLAGDKGPATKAQLNLPQAVAVAPDGCVYISDSANSRIRRVDTKGVITTICGSGPGSGEGGAGFGGDGGPAEKARLFSPADLKFNPTGQLYVSDSGNNRIRLIAYNVITTIAGTGQPGSTDDTVKATQAALNTPQRIAVARDGTVYIADRVNRRVRRLTAEGMLITVVGGSWSAGILVDPSVPPQKISP